MIFLIIYIIGALWMFKLSIKLQLKGDHHWDINDPYDLSLMAFLASLASLLWPLTLTGGVIMAIVKKMYLQGSI